MLKSLTTAKLLNASNARSKSTVNSSQHRQTRRSTRHTFLRCDELTVWRVDWFPRAVPLRQRSFLFHRIGWKSAPYVYGGFSTQLKSVMCVTPPRYDVFAVDILRDLVTLTFNFLSLSFCYVLLVPGSTPTKFEHTMTIRSWVSYELWRLYWSLLTMRLQPLRVRCTTSPTCIYWDNYCLNLWSDLSITSQLMWWLHDQHKSSYP